VLAGWGGFSLESVEGTWNLGLGQALVVSAEHANDVAAAVGGWKLGVITEQPSSLDGWVQGAKGTDGGAVRLVGSYQN
jgi:phosphoribosylformylglycinamidine cyclo-ligase